MLTDHLSELLLCASEAAAANLRAESVAGEIEVVGDVMVDVALRRLPGSARGHADAGRLRRASRASTCCARPIARATSTIPQRLRELVELLASAAGAGRVRRCTRARARACSDAGLLDAAARTDGMR